MPPFSLERLWSTVAARGRLWRRQPKVSDPLEAAGQFASALLSERGEASGAALARDLLAAYRRLDPAGRDQFHDVLATRFLPDPERLSAAAQSYIREPTAIAASRLAEAADPPRQELLRRLNGAPGATAALVEMRRQVLKTLRTRPQLSPLETDLRHLLGSWFNRGFLELRRIDWHTPANVLEKLIAYEAVHEIQGWDDLRRRLAPDRRCFAFFHPALPDEPLIFVEVALVNGMASAIAPLLAPQAPDATPRDCDTAIFYSISNCQPGLRGISFGNMLIKQVVEDLRQEAPQLVRFATLSPVPSFRAWLDARIAEGAPGLVRAEERPALAVFGRRGAKGTLASLLRQPDWHAQPDIAAALMTPLRRLCAEYLTSAEGGAGPRDPVARFHLGNGARLERINWLGNTSPRGLEESYGLMVNYLYDPELIEANHEAFVHGGHVVCGDEIAMLVDDRSAKGRVQRMIGVGKPETRAGTRPRRPS